MGNFLPTITSHWQQLRSGAGDQRGLTLVETLIVVILISTVGLVALSTLIEFTYSAQRAENYQQRSNALESSFGFQAARLPASNSDDLGVGARIEIPPTYRQAVQRDNPRVYYPLDETSCSTSCPSPTTVANAAPNPPPSGNVGIAGLNGQLTKVATTASGFELNQPSLLYRHFLAADNTSINIAGNRSLLLTPSGDANNQQASAYLRSTGSSFPENFNLNKNSFSLELWAQTESQATLLTRAAVGGAVSYGLRFTSDRRLELFGVSNQTVAATSAAIPSGYHYLVVTGNSSGINFFVDGRQVAASETTVSFGSLSNTGVLQISGNPSSSGGNADFSNGALDEVAIYPNALSEERIEAHYRAARRATQNNPVSSAVDPQSLAGDQLIFESQGVCYRLLYLRSSQQLAMATYRPPSTDTTCAQIRATRGPNQSSGPNGDPVLDRGSGPTAFNYQLLAEGVKELNSSTPLFRYYDQGGQQLAVDNQANSSSSNTLYNRLEYGAIGTLEVQADVSGQEPSAPIKSQVTGNQLRQRYQLNQLCPIN